MDKKKLDAIRTSIANTTIPEEMKLMYLMASATQSIVETVFRRIKMEYKKQGLNITQNDMLSGLNDYCQTVKTAKSKFYLRIQPQIDKATWGIGRNDDESEGNQEAFDGFNGAALEICRLVMLHIDRTANNDKAFSQVFRTLRKLPTQNIFDDTDITRYKMK